MPLVQNTVSVPANGIALPLAGSLYEYLPFDADIEIALNQQSGAVGAILATVNSGPDQLMEEGVIGFNARLPVYPDDFFLTDEAAANDRLKISLRNTTGGAIVVAFAVRITPTE